MSVIIRLQNLPWSANSYDIRQYFQGLTIPEGGVHIVGGELGDAFIAFSTDEDARQAMIRSGGKLKEVQVVLMLSSRTEMQKVIETARAVSFPPSTGQLPMSLPQQAPAPAPIIPQQVQQIAPLPAVVERADSKDSNDESRRKSGRSRSRSRERSRGGHRDRRRRSRSRSRDRRRRRSSSPSRSRGRDRYGRDLEKRDEFKKEKEPSKEKEDIRTKAERADNLPRQEQLAPTIVEQVGSFRDVAGKPTNGDGFGQQQRVSSGGFPPVEIKPQIVEAFTQQLGNAGLGFLDRGLKRDNTDPFGKPVNFMHMDPSAKIDSFSQPVTAANLMQREGKIMSPGVFASSNHQGMSPGVMMERDGKSGANDNFLQLQGLSSGRFPQIEADNFSQPVFMSGGMLPRAEKPQNNDPFAQRQQLAMQRDGKPNTFAQQSAFMAGNLMDRVGPQPGLAAGFGKREGEFGNMDQFGAMSQQGNMPGAMQREDALTLAMKKTLSAFEGQNSLPGFGFGGQKDHDRSPPRFLQDRFRAENASRTLGVSGTDMGNVRGNQDFSEINSAFGAGPNNMGSMGQQWNNRPAFPPDVPMGMGMNVGMTPGGMNTNMGNGAMGMGSSMNPALGMGNMGNHGMNVNLANPWEASMGMGNNMRMGGPNVMPNAISMDSDDRDVRSQRRREQIDEVEESNGPEDFRSRFNLGMRERGAGRQFNGPSRFQKTQPQFDGPAVGRSNRFDPDGREGFPNMPVGFNDVPNDMNAQVIPDRSTGLSDRPRGGSRFEEPVRGSRRERSPIGRGPRGGQSQFDRNSKREDNPPYERDAREDGRQFNERSRRHEGPDKGPRRSGPDFERSLRHDDRDRTYSARGPGRSNRGSDRDSGPATDGECIELKGCPRTDYKFIRRAFNMCGCPIGEIKFNDSGKDRRVALRFVSAHIKANALRLGKIGIAGETCILASISDEQFNTFESDLGEKRSNENNDSGRRYEDKASKLVHLRINDIPEKMVMSEVLKLLPNIIVERSLFAITSSSRGRSAYLKFSNDSDAKKAMIALKDGRYKVDFVTSQEFKEACDKPEIPPLMTKDSGIDNKAGTGTVTKELTGNKGPEKKEAAATETTTDGEPRKVQDPLKGEPRSKDERTKPFERQSDMDRRKPEQLMFPNDQNLSDFGMNSNLVTTCVLLKNLPSSATDRDICDFFSDIGVIPTAIHIMLSLDNRPAGDAYVEFANPILAKRASNKNGAPLGRQNIAVILVAREQMVTAVEGPEPCEMMPPDMMPPPYMHSGQPPPECVVTMENIPYACDTNEILQFFGPSFEIGPQDVYRKLNEWGMNTGFARVVMSNANEAMRAAATLNRHRMRGRVVELDVLKRM